MAIRGSNPVWLLDDLTGNLMDDTYYLWVLENDIPYQPATVWHDSSATNAWTNPIQVLANGTLPIDIFFTAETLYRLEFRKNDGTSTPSQSDALIYLITDYLPGSSGGNVITSVSLNTDNQITNAQFSLINFTSPLSLTTVTDQTINVAPGWDLVLPGTGNVTLTQVPLNSASGNINPTNAPYALQVNISNWNEGEVYLRQRFEQSGMLWAGKYVSASVTAKWISGTSRALVGKMYNNTPTELVTVLNGEASTNFIELSNNGLMPAANNTTFPPAAYVEFRLYLPSTVNIQLTSFQLIVSAQALTFSYEQDTIQRQIDHTYHNAYPIIPVGTIIDFGGFDTPLHYLLCDGAAYSRQTYNLLFQQITKAETVTLTSASATFTVASGSIYRIGMGLENAGIPANTTIIGISSNTITMSKPATVSGLTSVRFFAAGLTYSETVSLNSTNTFTVASAANYGVGMAVTGTGIPAATVISSILGTTITISNAATLTQSSVVTFYSPGYGDGSTTFNVYDLRDYVVAGSGGSLFGAGTNGLGVRGGSATHAITIDEMPAHTHGALSGGGFIAGGGGAFGISAGSSTRNDSTTASRGNGVPSTIVQQTALMKKCIRFE